MNRARVALLCASAWGLAALPARAQTAPADAKPSSAYVLSLWTDDVDDQADALTEALRDRVRHAQGWSLFETTQSFETLAIALKCPVHPDALCLLRIGDHLKTDRYVWGTIQKKIGVPEVTAEVHLWARGKADAIARESYADSWKDPNAEPLRSVAASLFATLTGAPPNAPRVTPGPAAGGSVTLSPGPLEPLSPPEPAVDRGPGARTVLAYSALVLGGGFLVAAGIEAANWISDNNASGSDRQKVPSNVTDVCANPVNESAQDACTRSRDASNVSTLGWIFAGVGAAFVGTGVVLLVTGSGSSEAAAETASRAPAKPRLEWVPSFGPRAGQLAVKVSF
jgi:hypothetical protein